MTPGGGWSAFGRCFSAADDSLCGGHATLRPAAATGAPVAIGGEIGKSAAVTSRPDGQAGEPRRAAGTRIGKATRAAELCLSEKLCARVKTKNGYILGI